MEITFEQMPKAMGQLHDEISFIKLKLLELLQVSQQPAKEKLLTLPEVAEYLHLSRSSIYMKVSNQEIPFMKKGKRLYFCRDEIDQWVKNGRYTDKNELIIEKLIRPRKMSKCG